MFLLLCTTSATIQPEKITLRITKLKQWLKRYAQWRIQKPSSGIKHSYKDTRCEKGSKTEMSTFAEVSLNL